MKKIIYLCLFSCFLLSCEKSGTDPAGTSDGSVVVVNEGNFGWGNATLGLIGDGNSYTDKVFETRNGRKLGDVFQSIFHYGDQLYLVINNSGKIEVVNDTNFQSISTIEGFNSPRYMTINNDKAFVSELFESYVVSFPVSDPSDRTRIEIGGGSGQLFNQGNEIAVRSRGKLVFINSSTQTFQDSFTDLEIKSVQNISDSELALIARRTEDTIKGDVYLYRFNTGNRSLNDSVALGLGWDKEIDVAVNSVLNQVYLYSGKKVYFAPINDMSTLMSNHHEAPIQQYYGWNINPVNGDIYLCDAKDYVQKGEVFIFDSEMNLIEKVKVGVIPSACIFR